MPSHEEEPEKFQQRVLVERHLVSAEWNKLVAEYELSQTLEKGSPRHQAAIRSTEDKFAALHQRFRSQFVGLYARLYQAKCLEEQGERLKSLGIYNELLAFNGESDSLRKLRMQATYFKLQCLNAAREYQQIDTHATEWFRSNPQLSAERYAIGIRFKQARALKAWLNDKNLNLSQEKKADLRDSVLNIVRQLIDSPSEFHDAAAAMEARLKTQ